MHQTRLSSHCFFQWHFEIRTNRYNINVTKEWRLMENNVISMYRNFHFNVCFLVASSSNADVYRKKYSNLGSSVFSETCRQEQAKLMTKPPCVWAPIHLCLTILSCYSGSYPTAGHLSGATEDAAFYILTQVLSELRLCLWAEQCSQNECSVQSRNCSLLLGGRQPQ